MFIKRRFNDFYNQFSERIGMLPPHLSYLDEATVEALLQWPLVNDAVEQAMLAVCEGKPVGSTIAAWQPPRSFTLTGDKAGVLLSMPGSVSNYALPSLTPPETGLSTLACKLVTSFGNNERRTPPLPKILANIFLFDNETGRLACILEGTNITAWRTAASSLVATKHLFCARQPDPNAKFVLAILGCGVQGRIHAIGMMHTFKVKEIRLWNRSAAKAEKLLTELTELKRRLGLDQLIIRTCDSVPAAVDQADVVVTATSASRPFLERQHLKPDVHINAIGAGDNHHSELSTTVYSAAKVYIEHWANARIELANLKADIVGELGEIINGTRAKPAAGITVYQSLGMAATDATVSQMLFELHKRQKN